MGIVALVSGGIDSVVMSSIIQKEGDEVIPLFIDYGQLAAEKEWSTCKKLFEKCNLPAPTKVDLSGYGEFFHSGLTDKNKRIYEDAFLPGRNMLFLLVGTAHAYQDGENKVAIGLLSEDAHLFPDQTEEFIVNANFALNSALSKNITILTPLIKFGKADVIKLARHYNIDLSDTYSCHSGDEKYCGKCVACKEIINSGESGSLQQFKKGD